MKTGKKHKWQKEIGSADKKETGSTDQKEIVDQKKKDQVISIVYPDFKLYIADMNAEAATVSKSICISGGQKQS